jgi:hypothetical protein
MTAQEAPGPRLTTRQIAWDALVLLRQTFDAAWPWWFFLFVLETGNAARTLWMTPVLPAGHPPVPPDPLAIGLTLALGAVGTLLGAFALRSLIAGKREAPRLDAGLFAYVGLTFAAQATWTLIAALASPLAERAMAYQPPAKPPAELLPEMLGALVLFVILALVFTRLALWPVARLVGRKTIGAAQSWRLMKGAVWPLIAASLILVLPVTLLGGAILTIVQTPTLPLAASPMLGLMASVSGALELAVIAAIWRVRGRVSAMVAPVVPEAPR